MVLQNKNDINILNSLSIRIAKILVSRIQDSSLSLQHTQNKMEKRSNLENHNFEISLYNFDLIDRDLRAYILGMLTQKAS